uniref:ShKT domain-containing protein n=1 Tax=Sphenodon punctatus TaxID=8508 RepID=A0A8D0HRL9_SPHPU
MLKCLKTRMVPNYAPCWIQGSSGSVQNGFAILSTHLSERQEEIVNKHNDLRRMVEPTASNMLRMKWNATAAKNAESWANDCILGHSPKTRRQIENGLQCGENLYYASVPKSWSSGIQGWFDERSDFIFGKGPDEDTAIIGHYTQMVWYKSYEIGCAVAYCPKSALYKFFYVCHYCPAGNLLGSSFYSPYTPGNPCGDCPDACDNGLCTNPCAYEDEYMNCRKLLQTYSCQHKTLQEGCKGSCQCTNEIQ